MSAGHEARPSRLRSQFPRLGPVASLRQSLSTKRAEDQPSTPYRSCLQALVQVPSLVVTAPWRFMSKLTVRERACQSILSFGMTKEDSYCVTPPHLHAGGRCLAVS